jgi:RND family efflux transporter MFP subunit
MNDAAIGFKRLVGRHARQTWLLPAGVLAVVALGAIACDRDEASSSPLPRLVRTVTVEAPRASADVNFVGHIEAQDQASLSFRISGRLAERLVGLGATVKEGQAIARLDPENELNKLRLARAALATAQGELRQAENQYQRQSHLLDRAVISRADFEAAEQARTAARSQVDAAQAQLRTAEEVVGFTVLKADAPGVVTAVGAEPGEVVLPGRMIVQLARREGRDAILEVPADVARSVSIGARVAVSLTSDPSVTANGRVREIAPQADPVTRTFQIRVGLADPPASFRLGTSVSGKIRGDEIAALTVPASALTRRGTDVGVWVVDPQSRKVSLRKLEVLDATPASASIGSGLAAGDIVVTAGASLLQDGQIVRLGGAEAR